MNRLAREIGFHDARYADGVGARRQDPFYAVIRNAQLRLFDKLTECVRAGGRGLEIGCGTGLHTEQLLGIQAFDSVGIDVSPAAVRAARRRFAARSEQPVFEVMDANHLDFPNRSFDFVFGSGVIHHLALPGALHEARRVLRPGGRFLFIEPLDTNPLIRQYRRLTPRDRSADETPLTPRHCSLLRKTFDSVQMEFFGCFTLAAIPLRRWPSVQRRIVRWAAALDRWFLKLPGAWRLAWVTVIDARVADGRNPCNARRARSPRACAPPEPAAPPRYRSMPSACRAVRSG